MRHPMRSAAMLSLTLAALACSPDSSPSELTPSSPALSEARTALPFKGTVDAVETSEYLPATNSARIHLEGTGTATQLGRFRIVSDFVLDLATLRGIQKSTLTAANGDKIRATVAAQGIDTGDGVTLRTMESATITGGTGRFEGATGSYLLQRVLVQETGVSSGSFEGTIKRRR
jgi:hypothetical protein